MDKLEQILNELYEIDPGLKEQEGQVISIISEMIKAKPDTKFDAGFAAGLRQRLMLKAQTPKPNSPLKTAFPFVEWKYAKKIVMNNYQRIFAGALAAAVLIFAGYNMPRGGMEPPLEKIINLVKNQETKEQSKAKLAEVKKFASKEEFLAYLENAQGAAYGMGGGFGGGTAMMETGDMALSAPMGLGEPSAGLKQASPNLPPDRTSQTNVQVKGIDEPDIIKTNGEEIFVSTQNFYIMGRPFMMESMPIDSESKIFPPQYPNPETKVIDALPADKIKQIGKLPRQGEMLLSGNNLMVFESNVLYGFDVSNPEEPKEKWKVRMENSSLNSARLMDGKIYIVTQSYIDYGNPCPIRPLYAGEKAIEILCTDIYHPIAPISDSTTYHAFKINPSSGEVEKNVSFLGSSGQSIVYMSGDNLYITYVYNEDQVKILADFLKTTGQGLLPSTVTDKINKLISYDISSSAKQVELSNILQKHYSSLSQDDRRKIENEMENKLSEYVKIHIRELSSTGIVKIALSDFEIKATGRVPGVPLNQFALDEYKGNLRIAVTISGQGTMWGGWSSTSLRLGERSDSSANDVYVLDKDLEITGSIKDLGLTERIYSARFIGEKAFLVTFRQVDPFYVLDLSDPKNPRKAGELKIPGFSSYL
ncbi:MAG: beta-propeller domain-containing protein, partial [Patescibacteria group bacterium]